MTRHRKQSVDIVYIFSSDGTLTIESLARIRIKIRDDEIRTRRITTNDRVQRLRPLLRLRRELIGSTPYRVEKRLKLLMNAISARHVLKKPTCDLPRSGH